MLLVIALMFIAPLASNAFGTVNRGYSGSFSGGGSSGQPIELALGEPYPCGVVVAKTQWYLYTPSVNGSLTIDTVGSTFDTALAIYTGDGMSYTTLVSVACNDDIGGGVTQSSVTFTVPAGTKYFIQVGGKGSAWGTIALRTDLIPTLTVGSTGQIVSAQSAMSVTNASEPKPCSISCKYTRWVRLDVAAAGTLTVDTMGSSFDTVLGLYSGAADLDFATLTSITCNDNAPGSTRSRVTASIGAGTYVWVQVGGKGTVRGTIKLNYHLTP